MARRATSIAHSQHDSHAPGEHHGFDRGVVVRTCVGCRKRAAATELLRVVARGNPDEPSTDVLVTPDPARRQPGRGAWLHPNPACLAQAVRRRAFTRALRISTTGAVDIDPVRRHVSGESGAEQPMARTPSPSPEQK